jgi:hypothetical protein
VMKAKAQARMMVVRSSSVRRRGVGRGLGNLVMGAGVGLGLQRQPMINNSYGSRFVSSPLRIYRHAENSARQDTAEDDRHPGGGPPSFLVSFSRFIYS